MNSGAGGPLATCLAARGCAWPAPLTWLETVDSTNRWLKDAARAGAASWSAVVAETQTAGRGRHGNSWLSPRGNLHLSVLIEPPAALAANSLGLVPLLVGTVVVDALEDWGVGARLKWPNDVRVSGRKLAGILVEGVPGGGPLRLVAGIGVNVNEQPTAQPSQAQGGATSLCEVVGREIAPEEVAAAVLSQLALCYDAPGAADATSIVAGWRRHAEDWWGRPVRARLPAGGLLDGIVRDLTTGGALVVEDAGGRRHELTAGEIEGLRLAGEGEGET